MRVISGAVLREFWVRNRGAELPLRTWRDEARAADWAKPADIKEQFRSASILKDNRVVFNIGGNKYRLVTAVLYNTRVVLIKFLGTHEEYDLIDAQTAERNG